MIEPVKAARVLETYCTIGRCKFGDAARKNTGARDSVQFSKEALDRLRELKSAYKTSELQTAGTSSDLESEKNLELLRLGPNATANEIRKAYLTAINRYHPDKYTNLPREFRKLAEEKTKEINAVYRRLMPF